MKAHDDARATGLLHAVARLHEQRLGAILRVDDPNHGKVVDLGSVLAHNCGDS